jgi:tartronate-semialdehyde synthase
VYGFVLIPPDPRSSSHRVRDRGTSFGPDLGIVSDAKAALELFVKVAYERKQAGRFPDWSGWAKQCRERKRTMLRRSHYENTPLKPQRVYEEMKQAFGADTCYVTTIGLSQIAGAQFLHVQKPRNWINCGQAGPLGWTTPAALGIVAADPAHTRDSDSDHPHSLETLFQVAFG